MPRMTDEDIDSMLSDLTEELDYDLWKGLYGGLWEDSQKSLQARLKSLRNIVRLHVP